MRLNLAVSYHPLPKAQPEGTDFCGRGGSTTDETRGITPGLFTQEARKK